MERQASLHPADETLVSYGLGKLDDTLAESVSKHLEQCDPCRQRVAELSSDSFVARLQNAKPQQESKPPVPQPVRAKTLVEAEPPRPSPAPKAPSSMPLATSGSLPAELVNHQQYEVIRELGRGGMGVVYLARNKLMDRLEVLKVLSKEMLGKQGRSDRFLREIQSAAKLHHPNVVAAYTAFPLGETLCFAMEYVEGDDLAKLVRARGPLPVLNACYFAYQTAQGLAHAHERGMIHRDIKPGNLILFRQGKKGTVKILDFGLAKVTSEQRIDGTLTQQGQMLGTPDYIAPEQTLDAQKADIRADIYSLGCTLYHLLTGSPPFSGNSLYQVLQAHHSVEARPLNLVRPEVPVELAAVVAKMMAKDPNRRYQTPAEVVQALKPFLKPGGLTSPQPELSQSVSPIERPSATPLAAAVPTPDDEAEPSLAPMQEVEASERWKSLIDAPSFARLSTARSEIRKPLQRWPTWLWPTAIAGVLLAGLGIAWAAGAFRVKTADGVIVLKDLPPDADVFVDGEKVMVNFPRGGAPAEISVRPGSREVQVKKGDLTARGKQVTIASSGREEIKVEFEPTPLASGSLNPGLPTSERRHFENQSAMADGQKSDASTGLAGFSRSNFAIDGGDWRVEGNKLCQTDRSVKAAELYFGDPQWTDYDFTVDAMRIGAGDSFSLFFRRREQQNPTAFLSFCVAGRGDRQVYAETYGEGAYQGIQEKEFHLKEHKWYTARVKVRGSHIECFLNDGENDQKLVDLDDDRFWRGCVGLRTWYSEYQFRNIKVTDPTGKLLWEGLPDVPGEKAAESRAVVASSARGLQGSTDTFLRLSDGKTFRDWKKVHSDTVDWSITPDGGIVGKNYGDKNGMGGTLVSRRTDFANFRFQCESMLSEGRSSAVWFRGDPDLSSLKQDTAKSGSSFFVYVAGSKPGDPTGSVRVQSQGNWHTLKEAIDLHLKPNEWFKLEVVADGPHVQVAINGTTVADGIDKSLRPDGTIALTCRPSSTVRFRRIQIQDLSPRTSEPSAKVEGRIRTAPAASSSPTQMGDEFVPLFNGKDFTNWTFAYGRREEWKIADGMIRGTNGKARLVSARSDYTDFRLRLELRSPDQRNKFVIFRSSDRPPRHGFGLFSKQTENGIRFYSYSLGGLKKDGTTAAPGDHSFKTGGGPFAQERLTTAGLTELKHLELPLLAPDVWHTIEIEAVDNTFTLWIDTQQASIFRDDESRLSQGQIIVGLGDDASAEIRKIEIKELAPSRSTGFGGLGRGFGRGFFLGRTPPNDVEDGTAPKSSGLGGSEFGGGKGMGGGLGNNTGLGGMGMGRNRGLGEDSGGWGFGPRSQEKFFRLFNGKDFTNWTFPKGGQEKWSVENGILRGDGQSRIATARSDYKDFHLQMRVRTPDQINKRLIFRSHDINGQDANYRFHLGGIRSDRKSTWPLGSYGVLTGEPLKPGEYATTQGLTRLKSVELPFLDANKWYRVEVKAIMNTFQLFLDGHEVSRIRDEDSRFRQGQIIIELVEGAHIELRDIEINESPQRTPAPKKSTHKSNRLRFGGVRHQDSQEGN